MAAMDGRLQQGGALRITIGLAAFTVIVAGLKASAELVVPFLLAAFIAILVAPVMGWLQARRLPLWAALALVIAVVGLFGAAFVSIIGGSIQSFTSRLPEYQSILQGYIETLSGWLAGHGMAVYDGELKKMFNPGVVLGFVGGMFNGLGNLLANGFLIFLTVAFLLFEISTFPAKMRAMAENADERIALFENFFADVNRYMAIKALTSLMTGACVAILLAVSGLDYVLLWALLAFLLNFIPNIGSVIAAVPAILLALVQLGPLATLWIALGYVVINTVVGNIIEPRLLGNRLGLSTLVVFLSLVFWGWILGTVGMFLSVPLTMIAKLALETREETRWMAVLLGNPGGVAGRDQA